MAKVCPIDGCQAKAGLCMHDKMMIVMGALAMVFAGMHWGMHWV